MTATFDFFATFANPTHGLTPLHLCCECLRALFVMPYSDAVNVIAAAVEALQHNLGAKCTT